MSRYLCSVSTCRRHLCACSPGVFSDCIQTPQSLHPRILSGQLPEGARPPAQHTHQGAWQGGTRRPEEPQTTKPALTTPALSREAWDPAITSSWERLLPLPGSTRLLSQATLPGSLPGFSAI